MVTTPARFRDTAALRRLAAGAACGLLAASMGACAAAADQRTPAPNRVHVTLGAHSLRVVGHPHPGRIEITLVNRSSRAGEFSFQPLKRGVSVAQVRTALRDRGERAASRLLAGDSDAQGYGEPAIVGAHASVTVVTTDAVPPGRYVAGSFLPGPHGVPQELQGRFAGFTIAGARVTTVPAQLAGTIRLTDRRIELPAGFTGSGTYAISDAGKRPHSFSLAKLPARGSLQALFACVGASFGRGKPIDGCPGTLVGGVDTIRPGATAYVTLRLRAGRYGYVSTEGNDAASGLQGTVVVSR